MLLVYTLFFAVPFQEAYVEGSKQKICKTGVYALCRHPGVLFLAGFYLFLSLGLGKPFMLLAGTVYTGMNLLYILLQDRYTFPRLFEGYDDYRKETPYLIPDADSIRKCISDLKTGRMEKTAGKGGDEVELRTEGKKQQYREIWEEYCSFLDLSIEEYMEIQKRLLEEQISVWSASGLGQMFLKGRQPQTIEDFRRTVPLTTYGDYADILLAKKTDMLPGEPVIWLQTTWEGGKHPVKVAPYTRSMLDVFRSNLMAITTLSSSNETKKARLKNGDKVLFGLAPLPFVTGLFPVVFEEEIDFKFLPPVKEAHSMSSARGIKRGFPWGCRRGLICSSA